MRYMRQTPYASIHLTHEARDRLRQTALQVQADLGRRVTLSEVVLAALRLSEEAIAADLEEADDEAS